MSMSTGDTFADPRDHPDNAHLPLTNRPETILGTTITFLVRLPLAPVHLVN